jgi:hypothetical protein
MIPHILNNINKDLNILNNAEFNINFEHIITMALRGKSWKYEQVREKQKNKAYIKFKAAHLNISVALVNKD